jgi:hypothetical protein
MNTTMTSDKPLKTAEGRGSLVRPRFTPGLLLLDEDLTAGVDYTRELSRLLFRNLFGCGVICGLKVSGQEATGRCLTVEVDTGLALDCAGDPIQVRQPQSLTIAATCDQALPAAVWVVLRRCEHDCMPRELACPPESGGQFAVKTRKIDCYEIAVLDHRPAHACGCAEPVATTPAPAPAPAPAPGTKSAPVPARQTSEIPQAPADGSAGSDCYKDHRNGICACDCCSDCEWVLLAKLTPPKGTGPAGAGATDTVPNQTPPKVIWTADYSVRRFIRPQLLPDPLLGQS